MCTHRNRQRQGTTPLGPSACGPVCLPRSHLRSTVPPVPLPWPRDSRSRHGRWQGERRGKAHTREGVAGRCKGPGPTAHWAPAHIGCLCPDFLGCVRVNCPSFQLLYSGSLLLTTKHGLFLLIGKLLCQPFLSAQLRGIKHIHTDV